MGLVRNRFANTNGRKHKHGTPRRAFTKEDLKAVEWLAKLGATNKVYAEFFGVHERTIEEWQAWNPHLRKAIKRGGLEADMRVAQSLYRRAKGFTFWEEEWTAQLDANGNPIPGVMVLSKKTKKTLPPDVKAIIHWLRIKRRDFWTIVPEILHNHNGSVNHLHAKLQDIPVQDLSENAQEALFEIVQKQLK